MIAFTVADHIIAAIAAAAAGAVNAIAGGGSLISFPTLVALGASRVGANVTNTVALCPGYFGGAVAQRSQLPGQRDRIVRLSIAAGLGGLTGSVLLLATGEAAFTMLVPWLILMACALLGGQNYIRKWLHIGTQHHHAPGWIAVGSIFVVSIYGGYFGAGGKLVNVIKPSVLRAAVVTYGTVLAVYYIVR